jgi:hypothetical protein
MYGLPDRIDLGFFIGRTLLQVCFGANSLILNFDGYVSVNVSSAVGCLDTDGSIQRHINFHEVASKLIGLIDQTIISANSDHSGTLLLNFNGGGILAVYDNSEQFESYFIRNGDQQIIV